MSWAVWQGEGNVPPEPDDSYTYIIGIELAASYGHPAPDLPGIPRPHTLNWGLAHVTYNLTLAGVTWATGLSPETVYFASFFVGKVALLAALLFLFTSLRLPPTEQAAALTLLAGYAGVPGAHGFFWVVPSFWSLVAFLTITGLAAREFRTPRLAALVGFLVAVPFAGIHRLALWGALVLILFLALVSLRVGLPRPALMRRWAFFCGLVAGIALVETATYVVMTMQQIPLPHYSIVGQLQALAGGASLWPAAAETTLPRGSGNGWWGALSGQIVSLLPGSALIWTTYLRFLVFPPHLLVLGWFLLRALRRPGGQLPALFLAAMAGLMVMTVHPAGYRTVVYLWPLTLIVYAAGVVTAARELSVRFPRAAVSLGVLTTAALLMGSAAVLSQSVPFVRSFAQANSFTWDESCAEDLLEMTDQGSLIEYSDKFALTAFLAHGLLERPWGAVAQYTARQAPGGFRQGRYFFVESPAALISRDSVERVLGRRMRVVRECGYFKLYAG